MDALKSLLSPLTSSTGPIQDTLVMLIAIFYFLDLTLYQKLVVIGGTVETARRASVSAWNGFIDCAFIPAIPGGWGTYSSSVPTAFFLTAHFSQEDYPYDWIMHWLSKVRRVGRERVSLIPDSPDSNPLGEEAESLISRLGP